ncbi:MAG: hypothetical protein IJ733_11730 [Lachnospiraceae bacterium]|nr:hypothetical protein [Lachnospiraceae bacterium]
MSTEKELITTGIGELEENVTLFYQQKTGEALRKFSSVLDRVLEIVDTLFFYKKEHEDFVLDEIRVKDTLTEAMNALDDGDMILLADIIQYDFIEYIGEVAEAIE